MANGIIAGGRAISTVFGGRGISPVSGLMGGWGALAPGGFYSPSSPSAWPRTGAMCAPQVQCCCDGPWNIGPGETQPLVYDVSQWLASVPGYQLIGVSAAALFDMTRSPPIAADPEVVRVVTGIYGRDPEPPDNSDVAELISLVSMVNPVMNVTTAVETLIQAGPNAPIGAQFKLDLCLVACSGCDGKKIVQCRCIIITVAEC